MNALSNFKDRIILLLGGEDKSLDFAPIFNTYANNIDLVVAFGSARKKIVKTANKCGGVKVVSAKIFADAVKLACESAVENNGFLLSPACTRFDEFGSYAERGEAFTKIVKGYVDAKN